MGEQPKLIELTVRQVELDDVFHDRVRVHHAHRSFAKAGKVIVVEHEGKSIRAVVRGAPHNDKSAIWLDLSSRGKLGIKQNSKAKFVFRKASAIDEFRWAWSATDAMPRIAARLGVISVVLGFVGAGLGVLSLCLAL